MNDAHEKDEPSPAEPHPTVPSQASDAPAAQPEQREPKLPLPAAKPPHERIITGRRKRLDIGTEF